MADRIELVVALVIMVAATACGPDDGSRMGAAPSPTIVEVQAGASGSPAERELLQTPFTAEQIRDEWTPGLELTIRRVTPGDEIFERWRVVAADAEGVDIEFATIDGDGHEIDEPVVRHSTWTELRDHASYPASNASRTREGRVTKLGDLEGWLYTVDGPDEGSVSELFFADSLPGAPVQMTVLQGGEQVMVLEQIARRHNPVTGGS